MFARLVVHIVVALLLCTPCLALQQPLRHASLNNETSDNDFELRTGATTADVVIVGGGVSGLVAARELLQAGYSVIVLEAQNTIGGRSKRIQVLKNTSNPFWVDEGGMWVGAEHTEFLKLLSELGLGLYPSAHTLGQTSIFWNTFVYNFSDACFDCLISPRSGDEESLAGLLRAIGAAPDAFRPGLIELAAVMADLGDIAASVNVQKPWLTPDASVLDTTTFKEWVEGKTSEPLARRLMTLASEMQGATNADPAQTSVLHIARQLAAAPQTQCPEAFLVHGGAGQVPVLLAAGIAGHQRGQVVTSSPVRSIIQHHHLDHHAHVHDLIRDIGEGGNGEPTPRKYHLARVIQSLFQAPLRDSGPGGGRKLKSDIDGGRKLKSDIADILPTDKGKTEGHPSGEASDEEDRFKVHVVSDRMRVDAKAVIVATPPHLAGRIEYRPRLSPMRDQLTRSMPMGSLIKYVAIYEEPFWRKTSGGSQNQLGYVLDIQTATGTGTTAAGNSFLGQRNSSPETHSNASIDVPLRDGDDYDGTHVHIGHGALNVGPRIAYDISPPEAAGGGGAGVLATFAPQREFSPPSNNKPEGEGIYSRSETASERKDRVLQSFVKWYGPQAAHPIEFVEKDWPSVEYVGGAFTAVMPTGGWTQFGQALTEPVGRIHWSGTETSSRWPGFYEGAVHAGKKAAHAVMTQLQRMR